MDELDNQIVKILNKDGRTNNKDIAKRLSVSEGTIRNRINKLLASGILKVSGLVNPDLAEEKQLMILGVNISASKDLFAIAQEISKLPGVHSAYIVTGRYDLMIETWLDTKYGLIKFLSESLASIDGITSTESFLVMKNYKKWVLDSDI